MSTLKWSCTTKLFDGFTRTGKSVWVSSVCMAEVWPICRRGKPLFYVGAALVLRVRSQRVTIAVLPAGGPQAFNSTGQIIKSCGKGS
jgi:hypothetical protein